MITFDLDIYWFVVGSIGAVLGGAWGFRRIRTILNGR